MSWLWSSSSQRTLTHMYSHTHFYTPTLSGNVYTTHSVTNTILSHTPIPSLQNCFPGFSKMKFGKPWWPDCGLWKNNASPYGPNGAFAINPLISVENPIVSGPTRRKLHPAAVALHRMLIEVSPKLMAGCGPHRLRIKKSPEHNDSRAVKAEGSGMQEGPGSRPWDL